MAIFNITFCLSYLCSISAVPIKCIGGVFEGYIFFLARLSFLKLASAALSLLLFFKSSRHLSVVIS